MLHLNLSFPSFDSCLDFIEQICISGHVVSQREDVVLLLVATADLGELEAVEVVVVFLVVVVVVVVPSWWYSWWSEVGRVNPLGALSWKY